MPAQNHFTKNPSTQQRLESEMLLRIWKMKVLILLMLEECLLLHISLLTVTEKIESKRILDAIKIIQNATNLPISVDTCRASVAREALEHGVEIINDISGLKYDKKMQEVASEFAPSLILCAYDSKPVLGNPIASTKKLFGESLRIAKKSHIPMK